MKNKNCLIFFLCLICILLRGQDAIAQESPSQKDDFEKMTFEVKLNKSVYFPLEPISVEFKFINQSNLVLKTISPDFANEVILRINSDGKINNYWGLFGSMGEGIRLPRIFLPKYFVEDSGVIREGLDVYFPKQGNYQLQFVLVRNGIEKIFTTNLVIKEPFGPDKEALEYLMTYSRETNEPIYSWNDKIKFQSGRNFLQEFVDKYSQSVYGEYAIYRLGSYYLHYKKDLEKANQEFEKLRGTPNQVIAKEANKSLNDIAKKKAKLNQPNRPQ